MVCNTKIPVKQPNSASDDFSKLPSRRRQEISTFAFGSAVERSILDRASVQIPHHVCCFFFSFLLLTPSTRYASSNPPVPAFLLFFISAVLLYYLLYCCTQLWVSGLLMDGFFLQCTELYWCTHMVGGWVDSSVHRRRMWPITHKTLDKLRVVTPVLQFPSLYTD